MRTMLAALALLSLAASPIFSADTMAMKGAMSAPAATSAYRFELAAPPMTSGGKSLVSIRLVHMADKKPVTGENLRAALFEIKTFHGLIPMTFSSNTATVPIAINEMRDGKDPGADFPGLRQRTSSTVVP